MKATLRNTCLFLVISLFSHFAAADVSGNWTFAVTLGDLGSGNADISMTQESEGKLSGSYSGQLANSPIAGSYDGNNFEFAFSSDLLGGDITYRGTLEDDGTVKGAVVVQGQSIGTFAGKKKM